MITGIILAAGRSRRMGEPKALLALSGQTFLSHAIHVLRDGGCDEVVVVTPREVAPQARHIADAARAAGARTVNNPAANSEQIDSLRLALRSLTDRTRAVVVTPVDIPGLTPAVVAQVIAGFDDVEPPIVVPSCGEEHGHPVLFARAVFDELFDPDLAEGARTIVHRHAEDLREVLIRDPAVMADVNTPAEYHEFMKRR